MLTTPFIHELTKYLDDGFAETTEIHGTLVDVYGVGLLFTGRSGIGKSEIALDLVERGHRLVADDTVHVTQASPTTSSSGAATSTCATSWRSAASASSTCRTSSASARSASRSASRWRCCSRTGTPSKDWNRAGLDDRLTRILGVELPQVVIPLFPGKNITVISEVIAMNHMLKVYGVNAAEKFNTLLIDIMKSDRQTRHYLRYDTRMTRTVAGTKDDIGDRRHTRQVGRRIRGHRPQDPTGEFSGVYSLSNEDKTPQTLAEEIEHIMDHTGPDDAFILLVDFLYGSCGHATLAVERNHRNVRVVSGVNLPMLLAFLNKRNEIPFERLPSELAARGRESIQSVDTDQL